MVLKGSIGSTVYWLNGLLWPVWRFGHFWSLQGLRYMIATHVWDKCNSDIWLISNLHAMAKRTAITCKWKIEASKPKLAEFSNEPHGSPCPKPSHILIWSIRCRLYDTYDTNSSKWNFTSDSYFIGYQMKYGVCFLRVSFRMLQHTERKIPAPYFFRDPIFIVRVFPWYSFFRLWRV